MICSIESIFFPIKEFCRDWKGDSQMVQGQDYMMGEEEQLQQLLSSLIIHLMLSPSDFVLDKSHQSGGLMHECVDTDISYWYQCSSFQISKCQYIRYDQNSVSLYL